jgi:signal transduction histidine kinase/CheY-like chemotaxis protein
MPEVQAPSAKPADDHSRVALDFVQHLLAAPASDRRPLGEVLTGLAAAFGATGAGLAGPWGDAPVVRQRVSRDAVLPAVVWPWEADTTILARAQQELAAVSYTPAHGGSCLAAAAGVPGAWLLWLEANSERVWTTAESAALTLAAQVFARSASRGNHEGRWGQQLERAVRQSRLEQTRPAIRRLAHDFGNVLTSILGFSELALAQLPPHAPARRFLEEGSGAAEQGVQLIQQLRLFTRPAPATPASASLAEVFRQEESRWRQREEKTPAFRIDAPADLPPVALDHDLLRQVLVNLIDNAREAIPGEGTVTVTARSAVFSPDDALEYYGSPASGRGVVVSIQDTGTGITPELSRKLLAEPFQTTKPRHRGLGLPITFGILRTHGGGLRWEAPPEGGTRVVIFLPATSAPAATAARGTRAGEGDRVLVVDDDANSLHFVRTTLEQAGYRVEAVRGGAEALATYRRAAEPFSLVLSDVRVSNMTGLDFANRLFGHDEKANVLFMSGQRPPEPLHDYFVSRKIDLLQKPIRPERLLGAVQAALQRRPRNNPAGKPPRGAMGTLSAIS